MVNATIALMRMSFFLKALMHLHPQPSVSVTPGSLTWCSANARGLLRELNPGPLAPEARIMPLDQAASCKEIPHVA